MNPKMTTRSIKEVKLNPKENITCFQLHLSSLSSFSTDKTYDFSENKLKQLIKKNPMNFLLSTLLSDYLTGCVALAWRNGEPVFIKISKDN